MLSLSALSVVCFQLQGAAPPVAQQRAAHTHPAITMLSEQRAVALSRLSSLSADADERSLFDLAEDLSPSAPAGAAPAVSRPEPPPTALFPPPPAPDSPATAREKLALPAVPPVLALEVAAGVALAVVTKRQKKMNALAVEDLVQVQKQTAELEAANSADFSELAELRVAYGNVSPQESLLADRRVIVGAGGSLLLGSLLGALNAGADAGLTNIFDPEAAKAHAKAKRENAEADRLAAEAKRIAQAEAEEQARAEKAAAVERARADMEAAKTAAEAEHAAGKLAEQEAKAAADAEKKAAKAAETAAEAAAKAERSAIAEAEKETKAAAQAQQARAKAAEKESEAAARAASKAADAERKSAAAAERTATKVAEKEAAAAARAEQQAEKQAADAAAKEARRARGKKPEPELVPPLVNDTQLFHLDKRRLSWS